MGLLSTTKHYHNDNTTVYPSTIKVEEKRAPTDESMRLVQEMEDKVKEKMLASLKIDSNGVKAVAIVYYHDMPFNKTVYHIRFELNGKEHVLKHDVDGWKWSEEVRNAYSGFGNQAVYMAFHKMLAKLIALELMKGCPDAMGSLGKEHF